MIGKQMSLISWGFTPLYVGVECAFKSDVSGLDKDLRCYI